MENETKKNELEIAPQTNYLSAQDIRRQVNLIQEVMASVMQEGVHYGIIPGCKKPSLYKAGAEKIAVTFRLVVRTDVTDLSGPDEKCFRVLCTAYTHDGIVMGSSVGECSSAEEKYAWRAAVCDEEFAEADESRRRTKWVIAKGQKIKKFQIRTNPSDLANTALQMADKRAYVSVVRKVTATSDVFTSGVEDLDASMLNGGATQRSAVEKPKPKIVKVIPKSNGKDKTADVTEGRDKNGSAQVGPTCPNRAFNKKTE